MYSQILHTFCALPMPKMYYTELRSKYHPIILLYTKSEIRIFKIHKKPFVESAKHFKNITFNTKKAAAAKKSVEQKKAAPQKAPAPKPKPQLTAAQKEAAAQKAAEQKKIAAQKAEAAKKAAAVREAKQIAASKQAAVKHAMTAHTMPHNVIAWFFSATGTIGGFGYLFFVCWYIGLFCKILKRNNAAWICAAGLWVFLAIAIHGMVDAGIIYKAVARLLYLVMGLSLSYGCIADIKQLSEDNNQSENVHI